MKIKFYKPTSPSRRFTSKCDFTDITKKKPEKKLTHGKKNHAGRDNSMIFFPMGKFLFWLLLSNICKITFRSESP
jgi:ribosomal protein L2